MYSLTAGSAAGAAPGFGLSAARWTGVAGCGWAGAGFAFVVAGGAVGDTAGAGAGGFWSAARLTLPGKLMKATRDATMPRGTRAPTMLKLFIGLPFGKIHLVLSRTRPRNTTEVSP